MPKAISIDQINDTVNGLPHVRIQFDNGDIVKINIRNGVIQVAATEGNLLVRPYSPNGVRITVEEWSSQ
jgi:hypothetical protein